MRNMVKKQNGITLIALVVTIIVLIILAGVSIAMLVGENGIITQAQRAAQETELKGDEEKIRLAMSAAQIANNGSSNIEKDDLEITLLENGAKSIVVDNEDGTRNVVFLDSKKIYKLNSDGSIEDTNSDFDSIYVAPATQDEARNEGVIGIGTDGQPVDMDLWEYTLMEDGTYVLNDEQYANTLINDSEISRSSGYKGSFNQGEIVGFIPQYISVDNGENYITVTSLRDTFREVEQLEYSAEIPSTITTLYCTYERTNLKEVPKLSDNLTSIAFAFYGTDIRIVTELPKNLKSIAGAFQECQELIEASFDVPEKVENMEYLFMNDIKLQTVGRINSKNIINMNYSYYNCSQLNNIDILIPSSIESMLQTFQNCKVLNGRINIQGNPVNYELCFYNVASSMDSKLILTGNNSQMLNNLLHTADGSNANIIIETE